MVNKKVVFREACLVWFFQMVLGFAHIVDGLALLLSFTLLKPTLTVKVLPFVINHKMLGAIAKRGETPETFYANYKERKAAEEYEKKRKSLPARRRRAARARRKRD